ncbi:MarR family transcriptional regulator [Nocardia terpenica]|uniref:MarR family winged helix-turn-helix transcriptional regulator n=1 Tax=Nocardia terpenica TaxID=455432 RepID=UPI001893AE75|nr:MarR family transcriptional regulator [Nocardia terpenica]MBF6059180.1 MarR family transcriptional regulator [Nocardia terpenica]MBF6103281.1 MarR family transcriptional regulator [Nocardia terpenica]MBF6110530.1 MarR family transcriptional regulator [Nocardia terpenica]MBF6116661.1 MarR family transcriptional regulator [Nocardia terpenica]
MAKQEDAIGVVGGLVRSAFLVNAVYAESGREYGLTPQQGQLLCVLMTQPYGMGELGSLLNLAKSSLTGMIDRTERNGLVRREPDPRDARAVRVALTAKGRALADEFYTETCRRIDHLAAQLAPADRDTLAHLLGRIVADNKAPIVFMEHNEAPTDARG